MGHSMDFNQAEWGRLSSGLSERMDHTCGGKPEMEDECDLCYALCLARVECFPVCGNSECQECNAIERKWRPMVEGAGNTLARRRLAYSFDQEVAHLKGQCLP